ncbi:MAG: hypothetical protein J0L99_21305 [Chitinophagales bacterium]|nr:hypothetical protein [Chitinophagales bacterium]
MSQMLSNKIGKLLGAAMLLLAFLIVGSVDAKAQEAAKNGVNPMTATATKLGVTAYSLGHFNMDGTAQVLDAQLQSVKGTNANLQQRFERTYKSLVLSDVKLFHISPEISAVKNLEKAQEMVGAGVTKQMMTQVYEATTATFPVN